VDASQVPEKKRTRGDPLRGVSHAAAYSTSGVDRAGLRTARASRIPSTDPAFSACPRWPIDPRRLVARRLAKNGRAATLRALDTGSRITETATVNRLRQEIRFARTGTGRRVAYAVSGQGGAVDDWLVRAPHWLTHLEHEGATPVWGPWLEALGTRHRLLRFDALGTGLSDSAAGPPTLDDLVDQLATVIDAQRLRRFALIGMSQGGAVAIRYAARHPERVSRLVLLGAFARGPLVRDPDPAVRRLVDAMADLVEAGWGQPNPAYRQLFTSQFFPAATLEQAHAFNELERASASPRRAAQLVRAFAAIDATGDLARVGCPTLVMHQRGDARVPFEEGRVVAAGIHGARFEPLEGTNHLPLPGEPAFQHALALLREFLPAPRARRPMPTDLTPGESRLLNLLAGGLDNAQIAAHLGRAEKTVRNRVSALFERLGVESRAQAIVLGRDAGFGADTPH
jgi:pimeloyl-ACP methyl ester carboxylesterase/DNA-binding CsgD family transcriptional regulator